MFDIELKFENNVIEDYNLLLIITDIHVQKTYTYRIDLLDANFTANPIFSNLNRYIRRIKEKESYHG